MISLESRHDGSLEAVVRHSDPVAKLYAKKSTLALSIWKEAGDIVRARLQEQDRGTLCYLQGNDALLEISRALGLEIARCPSDS